MISGPSSRIHPRQRWMPGKQGNPSNGAFDSRAAIVKAIRTSKSTGKLNLSAKNLHEIPQELFLDILELESLSKGSSQQQINYSFDSSGASDQWWNQVDLTRLVLADNHLKSIDPRIGGFLALTVLDLHHNGITALPEELKNLENLSILNLAHNELAEMNPAICTLPLKELHVQHNKLSSLPATVGDLKDLVHLDLSNNALKELPPSIEKLTSLQSLNLSNNAIPSIANVSLSSLSHLNELRVSHNKLVSLPTEICLSHLTTLDLKHNQMTAFETILNCANLKDLCLSFNQLGSISPKTLTFCPEISILDLRENQLSAVPTGVTSLQRLQRLDIANNNITSIPPELGFLKELNVIVHSGNMIRGLPSSGGTTRLLEYLRSKYVPQEVNLEQKVTDGITKLSIMPDVQDTTIIHSTTSEFNSTKSLDLSNKQLDEIPASLLASSLLLTTLKASQNRISALPATLDSLVPNLTTLDVSRNKILSLPASFSFAHLKSLNLSRNSLSTLILEGDWSLPNLVECHLSMNTLTRLEINITLPNLTALIINDNKLSSAILDADMLSSRLPRLQVLDVSNNNIENVPPRLGLVTSLKNLNLLGNPFRVPRPAILQKGTDSLLQYLRDRIPN